MIAILRLLVLAAVASVLPALALAGERLSVATWGGAYSAAQVKALVEPFRRAGIDVTMLDHNGLDDAVAAAISDVIDIDTQTALSACTEGVLEKLDWKRLGLARDKFIGADQQKCAVPNVVFGTVLAYDTTKLKTAPSRTADLFDLKAFPGKRALRKSPVVNLEWALIADGVAQSEVYKVLKSKAGIDRAFKKLDTIKDQIVWWQDGGEPLRLLANGDVAMASAWNGRVVEAVRQEHKPFAMVWDNQGLDWVWWAILKASPNKDTGYKFITFASDAARMADQTRYIAYGPANKDALALVSKDVLQDLPTAPDNMKTALLIDGKFWAANGDEIRARFKSWAGK